ncbi:hypothetical protein [Plastoroseomonas hellenica]|nr:hypothetical protein [Plastoroseomonas hellenica]
MMALIGAIWLGGRNAWQVNIADHKKLIATEKRYWDSVQPNVARRAACSA